MNAPDTDRREWLESLSAEEREEHEKHEELYRDNQPRSLAMVSDDWEKFDDPAVAADGYVAMVRRLGNLAGLDVMDAGCGDGYLSVVLAKRGAKSVSGFDISAEAVDISERRAAANGIAAVTDFKVGSFYALPYPDDSFDLVAGVAIIHHVREKRRVAEELARVLRPGGRALFFEPFGESALFERARLLVPVETQAPEDPEHWKDQVKYDELEDFRDRFDLVVTEVGFFSRFDRVVSSESVVFRLRRFDSWFLRHFRWFRRYARSIVLELTLKR